MNTNVIDMLVYLKDKISSCAQLIQAFKID